jgi:hypothetical protein
VAPLATRAEAHLEVRFFDAAGELIDAIATHEYSLVLQPKSRVAFQASGPALREQSEYGRFEIRLIQISRARP